MTFNDNKIDLPKIVVIKLQDKIKNKKINKQKTPTLTSDVKTRDNMVYFGNRSAGNCVDINQVQIYFQHFIFQMACILQPECNFLHSIFMLTTGRNCRCGGENYINAGDPYV